MRHNPLWLLNLIIASGILTPKYGIAQCHFIKVSLLFVKERLAAQPSAHKVGSVDMKQKITTFFFQSCALAGLLLSGFAPSAHCGGFAILEQSSRGLGQAFAGASVGLGDGSSVFYNPAAMVEIERAKTSAGITPIFPSAEFTNKGSTISPALGGSPLLGGDGGDGGETGYVPALYYARKMTDSFAFGLGINAPFGLSSKYDSGW
ncbi:MAG: hypothetical protein D6808_07305, partial [Candidatus Dadabacteria bacterium]